MSVQLQVMVLKNIEIKTKVMGYVCVKVLTVLSTGRKNLPVEAKTFGFSHSFGYSLESLN